MLIFDTVYTIKTNEIIFRELHLPRRNAIVILCTIDTMECRNLCIDRTVAESILIHPSKCCKRKSTQY